MECGEIFVFDGRNGRPFRKENGTAKITVFVGPAVAGFRAELVPKGLRNFPWLDLMLSRLTPAIATGGIRYKVGVIGKSLAKIIDDGIGDTTINKKINDGSGCVGRITDIDGTWKRERTILVKGDKIGQYAPI